MAFSQFVIGKISAQPTRIYNIDWAVGRPASNTHDDVMLVQALFRILYYELMGFNDNFDPPPGETEVIAVDGWYGPATQRHIDHFQRQSFDAGYDVAQDGRIDPYRAPRQASTIQNKSYTLWELQSRCQNLCFLQGLDNYRTLAERDDVPLLLRNALKSIRSTARQYT